jgi:hypothetical protein
MKCLADSIFNFQLNLVESLCVPPVARNSRLSASALDLLKSGDGSDMLFEVIAGPPSKFHILITL